MKAVTVALGLLCAIVVGAEPTCSAAEPAEAVPLRFGVMADVQYADRDTVGSRHFRQSLEMLEQCVADLNGRDLAFTIQLGDLIDRGEENLDRALSVFQRLKMPRHHVLGNHDFALPRPALLAKLGLPRGYYDFSHGNWRFVILDGTDISLSGGWPQDSPNHQQATARFEELRSQGKANAERWNGGIGQAQQDWLKETLRGADERGERVIVFCHMPALAEASDESLVLWNDEQIVGILESHRCVAAYLSGHDHAGGYARKEGIHHVSLQGMVEAPSENAYGIVELYADRIEVRGVGRVPSRSLPLAAARPGEGNPN